MQRNSFPWGSRTDCSAPGFSCCEIKTVSEGIAALLNGFAADSTHAGSSSNSFLCLHGCLVQQLYWLWRSGNTTVLA